MGDVGDYWREHREYRRTHRIKSESTGEMIIPGGGSRRRRARLVKFTKEHEAAGFRKCSDWHWQATVSGELLDYWPSKNKWRYRGTISLGYERDLLAFIAEATRVPKETP